MALYRVTAPNGKEYEIEGPAGASNALVVQALLAQYPDAAKKPPEPAAVSKIKGLLPSPVADTLHQVADVPIGLQKGVLQGIRMVSDMFGANNAFSQSVKRNEEALTSLMSAQAKNDQQEIARILKEAEDKGVLDQVKAGVKAFTVAPVDTLTSALGTAAPAIVAALGAKVLGAGALLTTGISMATGAGMGAGTIKGTIYEETKKALQEAGVPEPVAEERAQKAQEYGGQNLDQILAGAAIGGVAAKGPLEKGAVRAIASRISKNVAAREAAESVSEKAAKGVATGRIRAGAAEALPEAGQGAQEQIAANIAQQREGLDTPTFRGAVAAGTMEGLAGAGLGAAFGGGREPAAVPAGAQPPTAPGAPTPIDTAVAQQPAAPPVPAPAPEPPAPPEEQVPAPPPEGQAPVAPPVGEAPTPPEEQVPAPPPVAETSAPPPIEEPKVRKPGEPPAGGMQPAEIEELGISKKQPIYRRMLGKDLENPEQRTEVLADIENYLTKGLGSEESRAKLTEFKAKFAEPAAPVSPPVAEAAPPAPPPVVETPAVPPAEAPVGGAPTITAPVSTALTFETAKGSQYSVFEDGTTQRNKAPRPEHPGDQGVKERTARTIYVDGDASRLSAAGVTGMEGARVIIDDDGTASLVWKNPQTGQLGSSPISSKIKFYNEPAVGRSPLELWGETEVAGRVGYSGMHAGNKIVKITPAPTETPSVATTPTEPEAGGAGAPVVSEPAAVTAPEGAGAVEPTGVVPPVADAGQPAGREEAKPAAVTPEYTQEDIDRAVDTGLLTEEQAEVYRAELRDEGPPTAMGTAFQKQVDQIKAQMDALRRNGKAPAKKSPARAKYDELQAQLDALAPKEEGDLVDRLEKMEASGVVGTRGERPIIDLDAVRENLIKARAAPKIYEAILNYIGVDADGNFLPSTYSREDAAEMAGLARSTGANVTRAAQAMGITADVVSRFHAGQTDIIVRGKNVSEAGTGATDLQPTRGVLYEAPKKNQPGKAAGFLRGALTSDGKLDFTGLDNKQIAEIYARASNYDPSRGGNLEVIKKLNAEIAARTKTDRKGMQSALDRAYRVVRTEEEAAAEQEGVEPETAAPDQRVSEKEAFEEPEVVDQTRRLSDEDVEYRTIPQSPLVQNRASHAELEKVVTDIGKMLGGKVDVTILDDVTDVDAKQQPGSRAGAVIKGEIYLFRSGIAKGIEGQKTIFHELFHKGLKKLLPEAEYRALMNKFYSQSADIRAMADAYLASDTGKQDTKGLSPQDARALAVEESLAEVAEQTDIKPTLARQIGNFLARVADRIGMTQLARAIRTMGLNEQEKFVRDAIQAGLGVTEGGGATRFRAGEERPIKQIGKFGPIENASIFYWSDKNGVSAILYDQNLIDTGVKPSRAAVDQFDLDISKDGKTAEIHTHGVPPGASAVLSKYKEQISRVKPVGFSGDPYYKFAPGSFGNKDVRQLIRSLRDIAIEEGQFDKVETVKIKRATGATAGRPPREISREAAIRFRSITPQTEAAVKDVDVIGEQEAAKPMSGNPALKARINLANNMAGLMDAFTKWYGGDIRTAAGRLNPITLISRALDSDRISAEAQLIGGLKKLDGLIVASELTDKNGDPVLGADGKPLSYKNVVARIADAAKKAKKPFAEYLKSVDTALYGHREYNVRKNNELLEQQAQALEAAGNKAEANKLREEIATLAIKDPKKLDALEAAFQQDDFIKGISADLDTIRFNFIDMLVETGRISKEAAQEWKDNEGYIPFKRVQDYTDAFDDAGSSRRGVGATRNIKKFKGSTRQSTSVVENFSSLLNWATGEAMRNDARNRALEDMVVMGAAKRGSAPATDSPGGVQQTYENGERKEYYVPDPMLMVGFGMQPYEMGRFTKAFNKYGTRVLRAGVTTMPPFAIKQVFDDISRAYAYAGVKNNAALTKNILFNFPKNWANEIFKTELFKTTKGQANVKDLRKLGIVATFDLSRESNIKDVMVEAGAKKEGLFNTILRVMEAGAKASDLSVRQAIYSQVLKETGDTAKAESAAREIINFSYQGAMKEVRFIASVVPFFNAYAQGMDKLATAAAGKVVGQTTGVARSMFYTRMTYLTAMGLAYALMMQDDEEYNKLPDHVRDTHWILPGVKIDDKPVGIPLAPDLGFFFKAIPERVVRYLKYQGTDEEQAAIEVASELFVRGYDVFSPPNVTPQLIRPVLENVVNYSFFLGRPLESQAQLQRRPFERYGVGTSDAMKVVAEWLEASANATGIDAFAVSPIKLENAVRGLLGTTGGIALSMADMMINPDRTDRPLHQQLSAQLTGASAVLKNPVGTRYMDEIYNLEKKSEQVYNTYKNLLKNDPDKADRFLEDNIGMYEIRPAVQAVMKQIRALNKMAMEIDKDTSMSPEERRKEIDELRVEQNEIARVVFSLRKEARDIQMGR